MHKQRAVPFLPIVFALLLTPVLLKAEPEPPSDRGQQAAVISVDDFDLKKYRGQLVYLDFWASWCGPCKASFPWMKAVQKSFYQDGFRVIAVSVDSERSDAMDFLAKQSPQFDIVMDPEGKLAKRYQLAAMPSSYLIGPDGQVLHIHKGFRVKDRVPLEQRILKALRLLRTQEH